MRAKKSTRALSMSPIIYAILLFALVGCAIRTTTTPPRIALLAPFEGIYRDIGYNALYAARLAFADAGINTIELVPIDTTSATLIERVRALSGDPLTAAALVVEISPMNDLSAAANGLPIILIGDDPQYNLAGNAVFILGNLELAISQVTGIFTSYTESLSADRTNIGGNRYTIPDVREYMTAVDLPLDSLIIVTSAAAPDADFSARYQASDQFAPAPLPLATLVYDAANIALNAVQSGGTSRENVRAALADTNYVGLNGVIRFDETRRWINPPTHQYTVTSSGLVESTP